MYYSIKPYEAVPTEIKVTLGKSNHPNQPKKRIPLRSIIIERHDGTSSPTKTCTSRRDLIRFINILILRVYYILFHPKSKYGTLTKDWLIDGEFVVKNA